jgi:hypothetical protein
MNAAYTFSPLAGPPALSTGAPFPGTGAVLGRLAQMTLYAFPFCSFISLAAPLALPHSSLHTDAQPVGRGHGGGV